MERLKKESACEYFKADTERVLAKKKRVFQSAASDFNWATPLNACAKRNIH
jgi:hypothetical protein